MQVSRNIKFPYHFQNFAVSGWSVTLSHTDLGLPDPKSPQEAAETFMVLASEANRFLLVQALQERLITKDLYASLIEPLLSQGQAAYLRIAERQEHSGDPK